MKILKTVALAACLAAASMSSHAGLVMTIDDLSTAGVDATYIQSDPSELISGPRLFSSANWTFSASTGFGNGMSSVFGIHLDSLAASSTSGGTLRITFTQTDLTFGADGGLLSVNSSISGLTQGTLTYKSWIDDANVAFGHGQQVLSGSGTGPFTASGNAVGIVADPFSLTLQVDITHAGAKTSSFNFDATVPEPGSLALLSLALLGAGVATRRRKTA